LELLSFLSINRMDASLMNARVTGPVLEILGQPTTPVKPGKGAFDHPAFGQNLKARIRTFDDFHDHLRQQLEIGWQTSYEAPGQFTEKKVRLTRLKVIRTSPMNSCRVSTL